MAIGKAITLTFRIEPDLVEVMIRDGCGRNDIAIPEQGAFSMRVGNHARAASKRERDGIPQDEERRMWRETREARPFNGFYHASHAA
jgi:hypothetical protein